MSDKPEPLPGDFLLERREEVLRGESLHGPADSYAANQHLAELDARIAFGREQGWVSPEPEPIETRIRREQFNKEFPAGEPTPIPELQANGIKARLAEISRLMPFERAELRRRLVDDLHHHTTDGNMHLSAQRVHGAEQMAALLRDAEPELLAIYGASPPADYNAAREALACDRGFLELLAYRGRRNAVYLRRKAELGLDKAPSSVGVAKFFGRAR